MFQGSDPLAATCRGKLQSKRAKLNVEINKALMLRSGAENLYKQEFKYLWILQKLFLQSVSGRQDERECFPGAEVCQLQPAAAEGEAGRAEQRCGDLPGPGEGVAGDAHDTTGAQGDYRA